MNRRRKYEKIFRCLYLLGRGATSAELALRLRKYTASQIGIVLGTLKRYGIVEGFYNHTRGYTVWKAKSLNSSQLSRVLDKIFGGERMAEPKIKYKGKFIPVSQFIEMVRKRPPKKRLVGKSESERYYPLLKMLSDADEPLPKSVLQERLGTIIFSLYTLKNKGYVISAYKRWCITDKGEEYLNELEKRMQEAGISLEKEKVPKPPEPEKIFEE